eukprot:scaffold17563_cov81-Cylindrotheca_fusiformis.AAC.1
MGENPDQSTGPPEPLPAHAGPKEDNPLSQRDDSQRSDPTQNIAEAMMAELSRATAGDVQGEIFCYQAMFPNYAGLPEEDPISIYKATSDPDT